MDYDDDLLSCATYAALRRLPWFMYGLKAKVDPQSSTVMKLEWINYDALRGVKEKVPDRLVVHINVLATNGN